MCIAEKSKQVAQVCWDPNPVLLLLGSGFASDSGLAAADDLLKAASIDPAWATGIASLNGFDNAEEGGSRESRAAEQREPISCQRRADSKKDLKCC